MQKFTFHRDLTGLYSERQNRMIYRQEELLSFLHLPYSKGNFKEQIELKANNYSLEQRSLLVQVLREQYLSVSKAEKIEENLKKLESQSTFSVTTGHQLSLFTGPLFFVYKILHAIRLSEELNKEYSDQYFVPVYWMATEDHDFDEIKSVDLFGKTIAWNSDQKGPVGRFELTGFDQIKSEFSELFSGEKLDEINEILSSYQGSTLAEATFNLVHRLFGRYGLIILDADNKALKASFAPLMKKEIETEFSHKAVGLTNKELEEEGMKIQVHAREINLFYMENGLRERILDVDSAYFVEGKGKFTKQELVAKVDENPECFSPNVVLRPLYQEWILPNLSYIGGVGEIAYWLQLKGIFDAAKVPFPLLGVRNSLLWIDAVSSKKIAKIELPLEEIFIDTDNLKRSFVKRNGEESVDMTSVDAEFERFKQVLLTKVGTSDQNLEKMTIAELVKMRKQVDMIGEKLFRSVKSKHDQELQTIDQIKNKLFPANGLQERSVNLFSLSATVSVDQRIEQLHQYIDPFEKDLIVIRE